ncbi:biotin/lipoyl-binding protein, partial [Candidatus Bathyarchaeota archaeon]|nr:biotin/lipoyl-binding protein [Candidatus Bathyarchaeota archaeon]
KKENNSFLVDVDGKTVEVKFANSGGKFLLEVNNEKFSAEFMRLPGNVMQVRVGGKAFEVQYPPPTFKPETLKIELPPTFSKKPTVSLAVGKDAVLAPIAGRIVALKVSVGQKVSRGECICILEAMKMANEVAAPKDGIVKEILVSEGAVVNKGDILAVIT